MAESKGIQAKVNPYNGQAYFLYEPILPSSDLTVLNNTICHCQHYFNRVHLYYVFSLEYCHKSNK